MLVARTARYLLTATATALLLSACGGDVSDVAADPAEPIDTVEAADLALAPDAVTEPTVSAAVPTETPQFELDPAAFVNLPEGWTPGVVADSQTGPTDQPPPGGEVGPVDRGGSRWKYVGVLGKLKPGEKLVPAVIGAPPPVPDAAPLTGVPGPSRSGRRAVIVKIDNVPAARPQVGLNQADIVYEELVEAGLTRFAAVFHSERLDSVGPVRSGRSTDIGIVGSYNEPLFAFSGANSIFDRLIDKQQILNRSAELWTGYWRASGRPAPHNLFTSTTSLLNSGSAGTAPKPHFAYRSPGEGLHATARPATTVRVTYLAGASPSVTYEWNGRVGGWQRWQAGTRHTDAAGVQLAPENLVVQFVDYIDSGLTDKWGEDLYEGVSVGRGSAMIFTDGHVINATWTRPSLKSVPTFTDARGNHVELTPGQTHVLLVPPGGATWG